jgi:putative ABC transport system permease protein
MRWTRTLRLRLRSLLSRGRVDAELDEELQYHLERLVEEGIAAGLTRRDARAAAVREMGAIEPRKEACRDARGLAFVDSIRQDVTYAVRSLGKSPAFTVVAILSLALGIGANTAIFALWHGVLRASLPGVRHPEQLVMLTNPDESGSWTGRTDGPRSWVTYEEFEQVRDRVEGFDGVMASQSGQNRFQVRVATGDWEQARGRLVSGGFFEVLGGGPAIGRLFTAADDRVESPSVVLSHAYWQRRFGGRPDVVGSAITIRTTPLTIIGVAARDFIGETSGQLPDFWLPLRLQPHLLPGVDRLHDTPPEKKMWLHLFARLKPGVTAAQAEAQANAIFKAGLESFYSETASPERRRLELDQRLVSRPGGRGASPTRPQFSQSLTALLSAVGVLLLIACANLANLLLARGAARSSEMALRVSLGATRRRVVRQLLTESLVLAALGGAAAIAVADVVHASLVRLVAESDPRFHLKFALDPVVLAFIVAATVAAAVAFGLLPALQVAATDAASRLKEQSRSTVGSRGQLASGRVLVALQLALSVPLLVGAGLLARTAYNLQRVDLGFPSERLLLVRVDLRAAGIDTPRRDALIGEVLERIRPIPGVRAASFSQLGVFSGGESNATIQVEGYTPRSEEDRNSAVDVVGARYFSTLGIPVSLGREIHDGDRGDGPKVSVINEAFARKFFENRNPIGLHITTTYEDGRGVYEIVGVTRNARTQDLRGEIAPRYYVAASQEPSEENSPTFLIRVERPSAATMTAVRAAIERTDARLPITDASTVEDEMAPLTAQDRAMAELVVAFGLAALTLAAIGLYGVLSYGVSRRSGEIAVRIALGAQPRGVTSMIMRETMGLVGAGLALGATLAYAASRLLDSRLYGVAPRDPLTLVTATILLLVVALTAAYLPAHRASQLDPVSALR